MRLGSSLDPFDSMRTASNDVRWRQMDLLEAVLSRTLRRPRRRVSRAWWRPTEVLVRVVGAIRRRGLRNGKLVVVVERAQLVGWCWCVAGAAAHTASTVTEVRAARVEKSACARRQQ